MKRFLVVTLFLIIIQSTFAQWQMLNSPLATPDIRFVASHPSGCVFAVSNLNEVFRKDSVNEDWIKITTLDSSVKCLEIGPDNIIYAGIVGGYVYSNDLGVTWQQKIFLLNNTYGGYISDIQFNLLGDIFMSTCWETPSSGVWKSTDAGNTWSKFSNGLDGNFVTSLTCDSLGNIYALNHSAVIYKSTDQGINWQFKADLGGLGNSIKTDFNNNIFVGSNSGIFKSIDSGNNWDEVYNSWTDNIYVDLDGNIYGMVSYIPYVTAHGIMFSSDGGSNWLNIGLPDLAVYNLCVRGDIFAATSKGLRQSSNLGSNWFLSFKYNNKFASVNDILILSSGEIFTGTNDGVIMSNDYWLTWCATSILANSNKIKQDSLGNIYAAAGSLYRSTDKGISWAECLDHSPDRIVNFSINDSNHIYILEDGMQTVTVFRSKDIGISWEMISWVYFSENSYSIAYGIAHNSFGSTFISYRGYGYAPGGWWFDFRIMRRYDNQYPWITVIDEKIIQNIHFFNDTMYLATQQEGIYKSYDGGYTLIPINTGLTSSNIKQIIKTPENVLICLAANGVYRSLDNGDHWASLGLNGLVSTSINSIYYSENGNLYACTDNGIGVFIGELPVKLTSFTASVSQNKVQLNWQTATELNNNGFEIQRKLENSDWITIGLRQGQGTTTEPTPYFYEDDISEINSIKLHYRLKQIDFNGTFTYSEEIEVFTQPLNFSISQNYPNPFNPTTTIKYEIPTTTFIKIEVFDMLGRTIKILTNEEKTAGRYEVGFNATSFSSGVYYYRIQAGDFNQTRKMIIVK